MNDIAKMIAIAKRFGGGTGGSSEAVILPDTVVDTPEGQGFITTPLSATPTEGATAKVTYNGTEYLCPVAAVADEEAAGYMLGNIDNEVNGSGNPDAPFVVVLVPDGMNGMNGVYGAVMPLDGATSVTISIVQTEGAASGGENADGGIFEVNVPATVFDVDGHDFGAFDKPFSELYAAVKGGKNVRINVNFDAGVTTYGTVRACGTMQGQECVMVAIPKTMMTAGQLAMYGLSAGENGEIVAAYLND